MKKPAVSTLGPLGVPPMSLVHMPGCQCHHANTLGEDAEAVEAKAEEPVIAKHMQRFSIPMLLVRLILRSTFIGACPGHSLIE